MISGGETLSVTVHLSVTQTKVLKALTGPASDLFFNTRGISDLVQITRGDCLAACRSLAAMGLAQSVSGLMDDQGLLAGSGWCLTYEGQLAIEQAEDIAPSDARGETP